MSKFLQEAIEEINLRGYNVIRISEAFENKIETVTLRPTCACLDCYSVAKAFTVTAIGLLCDKGLLSVTEKIIDIFPNKIPVNADPRWEQVNIDAVLRHRCGFSEGFLDIDVQSIYDYPDRDFLGYIFSAPFACAPNERKTYSDGAYYLLSRVVTQKTGRALDEFLWEELFYKMGFQEAAWSKCPMGYAMGATGLYLRTEDMVKLGVLYQNGGVYESTRILSEQWTDTVRRRFYELEPTGHGDSYGKGGMHGQMLLILPSQNRVVAWHSYEQKDMTPLFKKIVSFKN